jgi:DNA topoisomerase-3
LKLTDANEVTFDFGNDDGTEDGEAPDFSAQTPLGACPKCASRVFELPNSYVCEKAVGPDKTCDFRSGRMILQRPIERAQMENLLATKKTDLLQFVSARTRRPFQAFLVVQPDGKVGFEFEAKDPTKARGARGGRPATALKVLGVHPKTKAPVELHSGKYGPYVKHGTVNATLPDRDQVDKVTLEQALELLAAKSGKAAPVRPKRAAKKPAKKAPAGAAAKKPPKEPVDTTATAATARTAKAKTATSTTKPAAKAPAKRVPAKKSASARRKKT